MGDRHVPVRMCIGCRGRAPRSALVRYVATRDEDGSIVVVRDLAARLPGRGAWLHDDEACVRQAVRKRMLRRALRIQGDVAASFPMSGGGEDGDGHVTSPE